MKAADLDFSKHLKLSSETGIATFHDTRIVIFDADAVGLLRQEMIQEMGWDRTRDLILRFGYQHGYSDFLQMKINYTFDTERDLLVSGPVVHTWEGLVHATPLAISFNRTDGTFQFTGVWANSVEAAQFLTFNETATVPVCWSLMGYASGWSTAFFGSPLLAIEPVCVGKGDCHCEWLIQPPADWGAEAEPYVRALKGFWSDNNG